MAALHAHLPSAVLHHDLKSPNVLVFDGPTAKITDFGMATGTSMSTLATRREGTGAGTDEYAAPEVWEDEPFTTASDVYAFGVIMWELATLAVPWEGKKRTAVMRKVTSGIRPDSEVPAPPGLLGKLAARCWAHDASERPSFAQLVDELSTGAHLTAELAVLDEAASRRLLHALGPDPEQASVWLSGQDSLGLTFDEVRKKLARLLVRPDLPAPSLDVATRGCVRRRLSQLLTRLVGTDSAVDELMRQHDGAALWQSVLPEYCPPVPSAPDYTQIKVLVIVAGMGLGADPHEGQYKCLERNGFQLELCGFQSPEETGFDMEAAIADVHAKHQEVRRTCSLEQRPEQSD